MNIQDKIDENFREADENFRKAHRNIKMIGWMWVSILIINFWNLMIIIWK